MTDPRPPHEGASLKMTVENDMLERRACPNCREWWDAAPNNLSWFCSIACEKRHKRGVYYA